MNFRPRRLFDFQLLSIRFKPSLVVDRVRRRIVVEARAFHGAQRDGVRSVACRGDGCRIGLGQQRVKRAAARTEVIDGLVKEFITPEGVVAFRKRRGVFIHAVEGELNAAVAQGYVCIIHTGIGDGIPAIGDANRAVDAVKRRCATAEGHSADERAAAGLARGRRRQGRRQIRTADVDLVSRGFDAVTGIRKGVHAGAGVVIATGDIDITVRIRRIAGELSRFQATLFQAGAEGDVRNVGESQPVARSVGLGVFEKHEGNDANANTRGRGRGRLGEGL